MGGSTSGEDEDNSDLEDDLGQGGCTYHLCSGDTSLYEIGWQNFGQAWSIWSNPHATYSQQFLAGAYMSYWGGTHGMFVVGTIILAWEALVPGSMSCMMNPACDEEVARQIDKIGDVRILLGDEGRVAVIGRNMVERVKPFADAISAETWTGFDPLLSDAENLAANSAWAENLVANNYTVYDIGLDPAYTAMGNLAKGIFYAMETSTIFGD